MIEKLKKIDTSRILGNSFFILCAITFLYSPSMFNHLPIISTYDVYIKLMLVIIIFGCFFIRILNGKKIDSFFILLNIFSAYQFIVTVINKGDMAGAIWLYWILSDSLFLFIDMEIDDNEEKGLKYVLYVLLIMMLINLYTVLKKPFIYNYGMDMNAEYWFGNYNSFINYFLPGIVLGYYLSNIYNRNIYKIIYVLIILIIYFTYFFSRSLTSLIVLSTLIIYLIFFNRKKLQKLFNLKVYLSIIMLIFFGFVLTKVGEKIFYEVLVFLNKELSLFGRTKFWEDVIGYILDNPIWGYGVYTNVSRMTEYGYAHAHNLILEIWFRTGLIGILLYIFLWKKIWTNINNLENFKLKGLLAMTFFVFWMRAQFETGHQLFLILMMSLLWKISSTKINRS